MIKKQIDLHLPSTYIKALDATLQDWEVNNKVQRLWDADASLWTDSDEANWLGWLRVPNFILNELPTIETFVQEIKSSDIEHLVVLGMGGSSLCCAMMAKTFGKIADYPRLHILDSTHPHQIRRLEKMIDLKKTIFIVSSKSGSTLEPMIFSLYFNSRLKTTLNNVSDHFIAITDPGSLLDVLAKKNHFRKIFYGIPSIGGRYSALSHFGIIPAALMGINVKKLVQYTISMKDACSPATPLQDNPGVVLGIILGVCANLGKDKVTLIISPEIQSIGSWLEQLLAESTGKNGKGLIPIDQEPLGKPHVYDNNRIFIYIRLDGDPDAEQDKAMNALELENFIVVRLHVPDKMHLGAELFRWEIATAVAGSVIGVNPFNQPDVEDSKRRTLQLTSEYEKTKKIYHSDPIFSENNIQLYADENNKRDLDHRLIGAPRLENYLRAHFCRLRKNDYMNLSAFIEMNEEHHDLLQQIRLIIRDTKKVATSVGFGPRFLHSTGQVYKGGPNSGVFLQITADVISDIEIPDHNYNFGLVIQAQAQGNFDVLAESSRRILRIHLGKHVDAGLQQLYELVERAIA